MEEISCVPSESEYYFLFRKLVSTRQLFLFHSHIELSNMNEMEILPP